MGVAPAAIGIVNIGLRKRRIAAIGASPAAVAIANVGLLERHEAAAQSVSPGSVGVAQVHVFSLVREQTVDLGAWNFGGFTGAILIEPDLIVGRATAYLRQVDWASGTGVSLLLSSTDTGQPHTAGPEFIPDVEDYNLAFTFADSGGGSVVIGGPNDPDSSSLDPTEPYYWLPSNNFEWLTWYNNAANNGYDVTLTIRAVPAPVTASLNLSAFAAAPVAAALSAVEVRPVQRHPVAGLVSLPASFGVAEVQARSVQRHPIYAFTATPDAAGLVETRVRSATREPLSAISTSPDSLSPAQVRVRSVERHPIEAFGASLVPFAVAHALVRSVTRHPVNAIASSPSSASFTQTQIRAVERHSIAGLTDSPDAVAFASAMISAALRHEINALTTSPDATSFARVQVNEVDQHIIHALADTPPGVGIASVGVRAVERRPISALAQSVIALLLPMPPWTQSGAFRNTRTRIPDGVNRLVIINRGGGVYEARAFADGTAWQAEYPGVTWQSVGTPGGDGQRWDADITEAQYDSIFATGRLTTPMAAATSAAIARITLRAVTRREISAQVVSNGSFGLTGVFGRTAARRPIEVTAASPASVAVAHALILEAPQHVVYAIADALAADAVARIQLRAAAQHNVWAQATSPGATGFVNAFVRPPPRWPITGLATSPEPFAAAAIQGRMADRIPFWAEAVSLSSDSLVAVQVRSVPRVPVESITTSPPQAILAALFNSVPCSS